MYDDDDDDPYDDPLFDYMMEKVVLCSPVDLVRYSFLVRKSLTPLDLSTLEFSGRSPTTFTEEGFQKSFAVKDRRVLFEYNLDVSHGLKNALKGNDPTLSFDIANKFRSSVYRSVELFPENSLDCLFPDIIKAIKNSRHKTVALKKFLPLLKMMQVSATGLEDNHLSSLACIFQEECTDSELVVEFVKVIGQEYFYQWLLWSSDEEMEHGEYFLHHMQKMNIDMQFEKGNCCPVSFSLLIGNFRLAIALIKYGKMKQPLNGEDVKHCIELFLVFHETAANWIKLYITCFQEWKLDADNLSHVKKWLFLLLVSAFHYYRISDNILNKDWKSPNLIKALQLICWSLPEPYLTLLEIQSAWRPDSELELLQPKAEEFYIWCKANIRDQVSDAEGPKSLQHLTRCEIRRRLASNFALPGGIQQLGLPHQLQKFLSLEC